VIVIARFQVPDDRAVHFLRSAQAAAEVLRAKPGLTSLDLAQNLDDRELWTITTRWSGVGDYRRALSGLDAKTVVVPLLSLAIDEPTAYEDPELLDPIQYRGEDYGR